MSNYALIKLSEDDQENEQLYDTLDENGIEFGFIKGEDIKEVFHKTLW